MYCNFGFEIVMSTFVPECFSGVFVGVVVSVLGRSVDALAPEADEGRGRPR